ncbi:Glyceraldehyde-3-phosphate dehydrogenase A, chloroplastic [Sesbania bispinosa]|nr:Glyceraldehyde-3-phosphate dehydrogenase A, chloroplastic [Sesbania bispinosa]
MAPATLSANGKGFSKFFGLRNSSSGYIPFSSRKSSEHFHSVIAFQTSAVGSNEGYRKDVVEAKLKVAINGFGLTIGNGSMVILVHLWESPYPDPKLTMGSRDHTDIYFTARMIPETALEMGKLT